MESKKLRKSCNFTDVGKQDNTNENPCKDKDLATKEEDSMLLEKIHTNQNNDFTSTKSSCQTATDKEVKDAMLKVFKRYDKTLKELAK